MRRRPSAFTLVELLVVIAIIAVLAAVLLPVIQDAMRNGQSTTAINKLRECANGVTSYGSSNKDYLPLPSASAGSLSPSFGQGGEDRVWYNDLAAYVSTRPLAEMTTTDQKAAFFKQNSLFYLPAAAYPSNRSRPHFAFGMNANLVNWANPGAEKRIRGTSLPYPSKTVLFSEGGIAGEQTNSYWTKQGFAKSPSYGGYCAVAAKDFVTRYKKVGIIAFGDNSVRRVELKEVVTTSFAQKMGDIGWKVDGSDVQ